MSPDPKSFPRRAPTQEEIDQARKYGNLRDHLIERSRKRTKEIYPNDQPRSDAFAMIALLHSAWDVAVEIGQEEMFMKSMSSLTGAYVQQVAVNQPGEADSVLPRNEPAAVEDRHGDDEVDQGKTRH